MDGALLRTILGAVVLLAGGMLILLPQIRRHERIAIRIRKVRLSAEQAVDGNEPVGPLLLRMVSAIGNAIARSGMLSTRTLADLEQTLITAGFRGGHGLGLFVGSKLLLLLGLPVIAFVVVQQFGLQPMVRNLVVLGAALVGLLGPDRAVRRMRQRHLRTLERGLPDALDLLYICSEAGLGLGPALSRVSIEMRQSNKAVADELGQTASELRVTSDSCAALLNIGTRTGVEGIKRLATTLSQSIQYGTPMNQALRSLSGELRQEMLTRFEARAARLPVMLTVPMIVFILPCVFLIVGGPAILQLLEILNK
jgi:tight adherence protein C